MDDKSAETLKEKQSRIGKSNVRRSKAQERRIAHLLHDWTGIEFRRRRVEGRDSIVIERESTADVIPIRGDIHFSIEAKCGVPTSFDGLLGNPAGNILTEWWHQATYDAFLLSETFKRKFHPLVFFKPNPNHNWIMVPSEAFRTVLRPSVEGTPIGVPWFPHLLFDAYDHLPEVIMNVSHTKNANNLKMVALKLPGMILCRWSDFARNVDSRSIFLSLPQN